MHDAITYAQAHEYPLLLLDGIPKFYHRFGYCDVYDLSTYELDRQAILALPESSYTVRRATLNDAPELLALYEHQSGPCTGSFARTLEQQIHWLEHFEPEKLLLAVDSADQVRGYLCLTVQQARGPFFLAGARLWELAVDDWAAAVALLQFQARQNEADPVLYSVPPMSSLAHWLVENLEVVDSATWDAPVFGWSVRRQTFRHRNAGWMARLVSLPALTRAMLPEWQARWQRSLARWSGDIALLVDQEAFALRIVGTRLSLLDTPADPDRAFSLTPQNFVQALFGYVPLASILQQRGHPLSEDLATVLAILFPAGQTWIPTSDWF